MTHTHITRRQMIGAAGAGGLAVLIGGVRPGSGGLEAAPEQALAATCIMTPAKTVGPYFVDEKLNRSDVRESQVGIPLTLTMHVFDADNDCRPLSGAIVDIWHCNNNGLYSDEAANNTSGQKWLRGYQTTDSDGKVTFLTNYPGWYSGRAVHIHYKVRVYDGATETLEFTSQLFFTDAQNKTVIADPRYSAHGATPDTTDVTDSIYGGDSSLLLQPTGDNASGYAAEFSVGVSKTTSQLGNDSAGGPGAPGSGGTTAGDTSVGAKLASVTSLKVSGRRRLRASISATEHVRAAARLTRAGTLLASASANLGTGTHAIDVRIPQRVRAGAATLTITLTDGAGNTKRVTRPVHVRSLRA
ncbi:MAG TPA: hypothetical protein VMT10_15485 [Solirubrobacteraceae bacterium]|nr:hypothetical protein [Solirubrobacteraceae bacterium]